MRWKVFRELIGNSDKLDISDTILFFIFANFIAFFNKLWTIISFVKFYCHVRTSSKGRRLPEAWLEKFDDNDMQLNEMVAKKELKENINQYSELVVLTHKLLPFYNVTEAYQFALGNPLKYNVKEGLEYYREAIKCNLSEFAGNNFKKILKIYLLLLENECGGFLYCKLWQSNIDEITSELENC